MLIIVSIGNVDGSLTEYRTDDPKAAKRFLEEHDHEGSSPSVTIKYDEAAESYQALKDIQP